MIEIRRESLLQQLLSQSASSSVLITGSPGIGKSWLLREFLTALEAENRFVIGFAAEDHQATSLSELYESIGLKKTIPALLRGQEKSPVLVLDGLDALRSEPAQRVLRDLIVEVLDQSPNARIVATIRSFDLRESPTFSKLLSYRSVAAGSFAELKVDLLSEAELLQVCDSDQKFAVFWTSASTITRELVRNPFNLQLALALLSRGTDSLSLQSVGSQVELLGRFWAHRVELTKGAMPAKSLLRTIVEKMIASRLLSVPEAGTIPPGFESALHELLSMELLQRNATGRLSFSHNIFFDYAVARVFLDEISLIPFVKEDRSRTLYYRPSLHFFFAHLWIADRDLFWKVTSELCCDEGVSESAKIIPAVVIGELASSQSDLEPLISADDRVPKTTLRNVLNAIQVLGLGTRRELWLNFLSKLSFNPPIELINEMLGLINVLALASTGADRITLGGIARRVIKWSWAPGSSLNGDSLENLSSVVTGRLLGVAVGDMVESGDDIRAFVRGILGRVGRPHVATHEIVRLAHELGVIVDRDAELSAEIFDTLYGFVERSEEETHFGSGSVMNLRSTRRQDYSVARYGATVHFQALLQKSPLIAARTAIKATNSEIRQERPLNEESALPEFSFEAGGRRLSYVADYCEIWDGGSGQQYTSLSLLRTCINSLPNQDEHVRTEMMRELIESASVAITWKRLLEAAVQHPRILYQHICTLLESPEFISAPEVTIEVGRLLSAASSSGMLSRESFRPIENAILRISEENTLLRYERIPNLQQRLLCSVDRSLISGDAALAMASSSEEVRKNEPFFQNSGVFAIPEREAMRLRGIDPDGSENQSLLSKLEPVESFSHRSMNKEIDPGAAAAMLEPMQVLKKDLDRAEQTNAAIEIQVRARGSLIAAAGTVFRVQQLDPKSPLFQLCRDIVIAGASDKDPEFDARYHLPFDHPSWGSPSPRIEAAQAVGTLIWNHSQDEEELGIFRALSRDEVPAVRFQIARSLPGLFNRPVLREEFWRILQTMLASEQTNGVMIGLLSSLRSVAGLEPSKTVGLLSAFLNKGLPDKQRSDATRLTIDMLVGLYVARDFREAREEIRRFENDLQKYDPELSQIALGAFQYLSPADAPNDAVRARARDLLMSVYQAAYGFARQESTKPPGQRDMSAPAKILGTLATRLYFAFDLTGTQAPYQRAMTDPEREQLYSEVRELLRSVVQVDEKNAVIPLVPSAAHYLLQLFNGILRIDAESTLVNASAVCRHGSLTGYLMDSLARTEAVKLVEQAFADHREVLRKREVSDAVSALLDLFIGAGWTEAITLSFRLDEAFR